MARDLWARRPFFTDDHEDLRASVRELLARAVLPYGEQWDAAGIIPRDPWLAAGEMGLLGLALEDDYAFRCVVIEECARVGAASFSSGMTVHADIALPYVVDMASPEQAERWVPGLASGELIGAIAMTEPGTGSDLQG